MAAGKVRGRRYGYEQVADQLAATILRGDWRPGEQLPSLDALVAQAGFSRMTVFKALQKLESDGLITMSRGRGTFVREHPARPAVGFVTCHLLDAPFNGFSNQVAKSLEKLLHARGWNLRLYADANEGGAGSASWELIEALEKQALRGLVTVNSNLPGRYLRSPDWQRVAIPHVDMSVHASRYRIDTASGARTRLIRQFCLERGIREIGIIRSGGGFDLGALAAAGIVCPPGWDASLPTNVPFEEGGYRLMHELWQQPRRPRALFVADDVVAKGVLQALLALQVKVPDELLPIASVNAHSGMFYPVPTVKLVIDSDLIARAMLDLLDQIRHDPDLPPTTTEVAPTLDASMLDG